MHELFFPDGSCPSDSILQHFLRIAETTDGRPPALECSATSLARIVSLWMYGILVPVFRPHCCGTCDTRLWESLNLIVEVCSRQGNNPAQCHREWFCCEAILHSLTCVALR